ncbi:CsbD family protein [Ramlibacter ginsenosidimutans]|uniref:CsbD family protein n=1 Tax=Ramlibacter ginsenosidimutans TaxID=502333 RepID=UPI0030F47647
MNARLRAADSRDPCGLSTIVGVCRPPIHERSSASSWRPCTRLWALHRCRCAARHRRATGRAKVNGAANQAAGEAKKQVGKLTGDTSREIGGAAQQIKGKVQEKMGDAKESAREADKQAQREEGKR